MMQYCLATAKRRMMPGEPDAGNPHVRFDEGGLTEHERIGQSSTLLVSVFVLEKD